MDNGSRQEVTACVCQCVFVRMYWTCGCKGVWSVHMFSLFNRHMWQSNTQQQFPLSRLFPLLLSQRTTPLISLDVLARYSMKQMALQVVVAQGGRYSMCLVMMCTHLYEHRKSGFNQFHHVITHKSDPGGFRVEPTDQLTNAWTCLCFISQPHSEVDTIKWHFGR